MSKTTTIRSRVESSKADFDGGVSLSVSGLVDNALDSFQKGAVSTGKSTSSSSSGSSTKAEEKPRSVWAGGALGGVSVSKSLVDTVTYVDNAHAESDSAEITLDNSDGKFLGKSKPYKGESGSVRFETRNWKLNKDTKIKSGKMYVSSFSGTGSGTETVGVSLLSMPSYKGFSATSHTKTYKKTTAKTILKKIAKRNSLTLKYYGPTVKIQKIKQDGQTDSDFATDLCERYGLRVKVYNKQLVVYSATRYARKKPVATIKKAAIIGDYSYESDILGAYSAATNTYQDKKKKKDRKVIVGHPKYKKVVTYSYIAKTQRKIKIYKKKSKSSKVLATVPKGKKLRIVKRYKDGWAKVVFVKKTKKQSKGESGASGDLAALFKTAKSQIGRGNHYNSDGAAWCVDFVKWCFRHSGNGHKLAGLGGIRWVGGLRNWGARKYSYGRTPHPGDIAIFNYGAHTEIVYKVYNRNHIVTIGGNTTWEHFKGYRKKVSYGHCVSMKNRYNRYYHFDGFIHIPWKKSDRRGSSKTTTTSSHRYGYIYIGKTDRNAKVIKKKHIKKARISRTLKVDTAGYNKSDAKRIAKYKLAQANEKIETLTLTIPGGNRKIIASSTVKLGDDWGSIKGKYFVDSVQHSYGASAAYTAELTLHRITSSNVTHRTFRKPGTKVKFKGGYVHSSSKGGKKHKAKAGTVKIKKVDKKGKYAYQIKSLPKYAKWKKRKVKVREYNRKTGANGKKLTSSCCACDWLPIGSKIRIGGKTYTVADRTHGKGGILIWKKSPSTTVKTVTAKYKKLTKRSKVIGWVSSSELASLTSSQKKSSSSRKESNNKHQHHSSSGGKGKYSAHGKSFKVVATHKANYSCYALPYGSFMRKRVGSWTGMCCAAPKQLPIGSFVRITGTGSEWDGKIMKVVDRGGAIYIHPNGEWWIDVHFTAGSSGYKRFLRKGRYHGKVQVLKKV